MLKTLKAASSTNDKLSVKLYWYFIWFTWCFAMKLFIELLGGVRLLQPFASILFTGKTGIVWFSINKRTLILSKNLNYLFVTKPFIGCNSDEDMLSRAKLLPLGIFLTFWKCGWCFSWWWTNGKHMSSAKCWASVRFNESSSSLAVMSIKIQPIYNRYFKRLLIIYILTC